MSRALRHLQWIGLVLFAVSACLPGFPFRIGTPDLPEHLQPGDAAIVLIGPPGPQRVPVREVAGAVGESLSGGQDAFWTRRALYFYAVLPIWGLALLLARISRRWRRAVGVSLWVVTLGIIVLEAMYLESDYEAFLPLLGRLETGIAWCVVVTLLVYRRPVDRSLVAVEASIGAQALLGVVHGATLPATFVREHVGHAPLGAVLEAVGSVFAPGFWIGMVGLVLAALPAYIGKRDYGEAAAGA